jgi:hypothetical protein
MDTGRKTVGDILGQLGAGPELAGKVLDIIDCFIAGDAADSLDAKVFFDAHLIASYEEKTCASHEAQTLADDLQKQCLTDTGRRLLNP